jgi:hypothetical protein
MDLVYAVTSQPMDGAPGGWLRKGTHWPADDPVVRSHPDLFSTDPRFGLWYSVEPDGYDAPIETASAGPGEKRSVRRG